MLIAVPAALRAREMGVTLTCEVARRGLQCLQDNRKAVEGRKAVPLLQGAKPPKLTMAAEKGRRCGEG